MNTVLLTVWKNKIMIKEIKCKWEIGKIKAAFLYDPNDVKEYKDGFPVMKRKYGKKKREIIKIKYKP